MPILEKNAQKKGTTKKRGFFPNFSCMFLYPNIFFPIRSLSDMRNLQKQVEKAFCYKKKCSDLSLFCKFLAFSLEFQKIFLITI